MKNIYVIPTNKPSRLVKVNIYGKDKIHLCKKILPIRDEEQYQNIYITSNEKIKDEDIDKFTCIFISDNVVTTLAGKGYGRVKTIGKYYKILLTDNEYLIKDGVQAIDDKFLEWFVKNPSCEEVPIITTTVNNKLLYKTNIGFESWRKEEPKQKIKEICKCRRGFENPLSEICSLCWNELYPNEKDEIEDEDLLEPDQETIENEQIVEMLKQRILEVESRIKHKDPEIAIVTVHLTADVFLKMAYLYVGLNGK